MNAMANARDDDWDDYDETDWSEDDEEDDPFSCDHCGPWCEYWGGDGLCDLAIQAQMAEDERYHRRYVIEDYPCPECREKLRLYKIPADRLWVWPGVWPDDEYYSPMIALGIFCVYDAPKGELHRKDNICHIWTGLGEYREEKLIHLMGSPLQSSEPEGSVTRADTQIPF